VIPTDAGAETVVVVMLKVALVPPDGTVTLAGTAAAALFVARVTTAPPEGAAVFSVAVPVAPVPPVTLDGLTAIADSAGAAGVACGVKLLTLDQFPAEPAELRPRTRHQCCRDASDVAVNCDTDTV
jgi:hypothetical protein